MSPSFLEKNKIDLGAFIITDDTYERAIEHYIEVGSIGTIGNSNEANDIASKLDKVIVESKAIDPDVILITNFEKDKPICWILAETFCDSSLTTHAIQSDASKLKKLLNDKVTDKDNEHNLFFISSGVGSNYWHIFVTSEKFNLAEMNKLKLQHKLTNMRTKS